MCVCVCMPVGYAAVKGLGRPFHYYYSTGVCECVGERDKKKF